MIADPSEEDMFEFGGGGSYKGRLPPFGFPPMGGNNSGGSSSNNWKMPNKVDEYIRAKNRYEPREEREPPLRYEGRGGLNPFSKIPN